MNNQAQIKAMIVDDEAPMRAHLKRRLQQAWPELLIVAEANNGVSAIEQAHQNHVDLIFLDIRMPGKNGIETASQLAGKAQLVFVTAYDEYAVQAFEQGAIDYLLKPIEFDRLKQTCSRIQQRLSSAVSQQSSLLCTEQLTQILKQLLVHQKPQYLQWIQASVGNSLRMINTKEILFFKSDDKYTLVQTAQAEYLIRKTLKELEDELNPKEFMRIHRSCLVRVDAIHSVRRDERGRQMLDLNGYGEKLEISRNHSHLFQTM